VLNGKNHLTNGGKIYVVIQKKQGAESCLKAMKEVYTTVDVIDKDNGYFIIKAIK
jgi:16S rRNA (guanine1207-N2)-methyltransferase